jgi:glycosyltransferase involved in cell wall biosynthesis
MRILFSVHLYPPAHNAGGEYYAHNLALYLVSKGHEVRVLLHDGYKYGIDDIYNFQGIDVFPPNNTTAGLFGWADVIITHLGYTKYTLILAQSIGKPVAFISHNTWPYDEMGIWPDSGVIYNSYAMKGILNYKNKSVVLRPSMDRKYDDFKDRSSNPYITLVNLNKNKGGKIFFNIAKAMPHRKFLGVKGGYDEQVVMDLPNVEIIENTPDMKGVYEKTRILLVPSKYESWGMCATEAMAMGIPVIYNSTFGLAENVGQGGIQVADPNPDYMDDDIPLTKLGERCEPSGIDPGNYKAWVKAIRGLNKAENYALMAEAGKTRAKELMAENALELAQTEQFLIKLYQDNVSLISQRYLQG